MEMIESMDGYLKIKIASFKKHAYPPAGGLLCSSLKKIIIGIPLLFSKLLRKVFKKQF
ncbi:MAG: hypothetical protein AAB902_02510 [Patescibacteria group bacterium]